MDASDELKQKCFFDLLMTVDGREERFGHVIIEMRVLSHFSNNVHLALTEVRVNLVPNDTFIE